MDLVEFHQKLFGSKIPRTPKQFRVTPQQRRLYKGFPHNKGFSVTLEQAKVWRNPERFLGSLVLALAQARPYEGRIVYLFFPRHYGTWIEAQIREIAQYALQRRRGNLEAIRLFKDIVHQLRLSGDFAQMTEPEHWATYGFCHEGDLPDWIGCRLIKASK